MSHKSVNFGKGRGRGIRLNENEPSESMPMTAPVSALRRLAIGRGVASTRSEPKVEEPAGCSGFFKTRPASALESKEGSSGSEVQLSANYFKLIPGKGFELNQYRVDFEPEIDEVRFRKSIIRNLSEKFKGYLYDGDKILYLTHRLDTAIIEFRATASVNDPKEYTVRVKHTGVKIDMTDQGACQVLNLILRRAMDGIHLQLVGRNLYDPKAPVILPDHKVELWPGYITSIRQHEHDTLVCCEVSHKVMRQQTIYDIMVEHKGRESDWQESFKREIIGSIVLTAYNNRTYRIDDVDFCSSPKSTFKQRNKETKSEDDVSYCDYYQQRYNCRIRDNNQPMLVAKARFRDNQHKEEAEKMLFLVPELCRATGLTDKMRANFRMMRDMAEHTQMDPVNRTKRLLALTKRLKESKESMEQLQLFGVEIEGQLVSFKGRALPQEKIVFGDGKTFQNDSRVDWTNPMKVSQMCVTVPLKRWMLIYPKRAWNDTETFLKLMKEVAFGMKFDLADPKLIELDNDNAATYSRQLREAASKDPKLIVVVVPNNAADRYAVIKKETYLNKAIPSQVVVLKTMQPKKGNMGGVKSIATKVMIQINCKLGGAAWNVNFPMDGVMTIGFDVNHDTMDKRGKSYGAFVASMDLKKEILYYSKVTCHKDGTEMSANIEISITEALHKFKELHNSLPERLFFYRDGVSDSQVEFVHNHEVRMIRETLAKYYTDSEPKFTFIVVNKRINTRIFLKGSQPKNPDSGTIVDNTVTLPERYDFFLISQSVRQGTVSPTSYNVIYDTNNLGPDKIQRFTYKNTHLYYNWSGTVRVPAVCQYAHKLALLVGEHIHDLPNSGLEKLLYFL